MNIFKRIYCRIYQKILFIAMHFIYIKIPKTYSSIDDLKDILSSYKYKKPLFIMTKHATRDEKVLNTINSCKNLNYEFAIYSDVSSDPTFSDIEKLYLFYIENKCDCIIAIGGGSVLDIAKALGCKITHPNKTMNSFKGLLKVKKKIPFIIAIPTTAGTGSEATVASVITDDSNNDKFAINDPHLIPDNAILDSSLLSTLPKDMISTTGIDALTHAIESYIGKSNTKLSEKYALNSIKLIMNNIYQFYINSDDSLARENMLQASFYAGVAFTRGYVGYIHALAHSIGGKYHLSHGYCISILLLPVLREYKSAIDKRISNIVDYVYSDNNIKNKKEYFLSQIEKLEKKMSIPTAFNCIKEEDIPSLIDHALKEANPLYPVPKELGYKELEEIIREVK